MAKIKSSSESNKMSFGTKKSGKAQKSYNKHDKKSRSYRGQGKV